MSSVKPGSWLFFLLSVTLFTAQAQGKFITEKGKISFISEAQLELIRASSDALKGIIDPSNNQFAFRVNIQTFQGFNSALQKEHFNENYLESEKCPTATFSGKLIEQIDFTQDGTYEVRAKGDLDIHCQKQTRIIKSKITIKEAVVTVESNFMVPLADHHISIPRIVNQKIATDIGVTVVSTLTIQK